MILTRLPGKLRKLPARFRKSRPMPNVGLTGTEEASQNFGRAGCIFSSCMQLSARLGATRLIGRLSAFPQS